MLPDRSISKGQKLVKNAKKIKCDILSQFQTMCKNINSGKLPFSLMIRFLFPSSLENDKLFIGTSGLRVQLPVIGKAVTNQSSKTGRGNFHEIAPIILRKEKWGTRRIVNNQNFHFFV